MFFFHIFGTFLGSISNLLEEEFCSTVCLIPKENIYSRAFQAQESDLRCSCVREQDFAGQLGPFRPRAQSGSYTTEPRYWGQRSRWRRRWEEPRGSDGTQEASGRATERVYGLFPSPGLWGTLSRWDKGLIFGGDNRKWRSSEHSCYETP